MLSEAGCDGVLYVGVCQGIRMPGIAEQGLEFVGDRVRTVFHLCKSAQTPV